MRDGLVALRDKPGGAGDTYWGTGRAGSVRDYAGSLTDSGRGSVGVVGVPAGRSFSSEIMRIAARRSGTNVYELSRERSESARTHCWAHQPASLFAT